MRTADRHRDDDVVKGPSLARVPTHLIGTILLVFGLGALVEHNDLPAFGEAFPDGTATGGTFLGIGVNGWTAWGCIATGGLLLVGAAQHVAARTMALLGGLVLGAAAVIALSDGDDVLGLAYANGATKLALGITAAVLLLTALLPRKRTTVEHEHEHHVEPVQPADRAGRFDRDRDHDPVAEHPTQQALAGAAAERAHEAREHHAEPRTEVVGPSGPGPAPTATSPLGTTDRSHPAAPVSTTGTHRSGGLVGRVRRKDDR